MRNAGDEYRRGLLPERGMQFGFQFFDLFEFGLVDDPPPPGLTGARQGREHPFQDSPGSVPDMVFILKFRIHID